MAMFMTHMAIAGMAKMAIMVTIVMANGKFSMAVRGIQLKGTQKLAQWCKIHSNWTFRIDIINICDFSFFTPFLHCVNADSLRQILQKLVHLMTKNF